jgi:hypothetical protein
MTDEAKLVVYGTHQFELIFACISGTCTALQVWVRLPVVFRMHKLAWVCVQRQVNVLFNNNTHESTWCLPSLKTELGRLDVGISIRVAFPGNSWKNIYGFSTVSSGRNQMITDLRPSALPYALDHEAADGFAYIYVHIAQDITIFIGQSDDQCLGIKIEGDVCGEISNCATSR